MARPRPTLQDRNAWSEVVVWLAGRLGSRSELAVRLGSSRMTVHRWITGFSVPTGQTRERLLDLYREEAIRLWAENNLAEPPPLPQTY